MSRLAFALAGLLLGGAALAAEPETPPFQAIRNLQSLQEQVAHGNTTAQAAQPPLMAHIAEGFLKAEPAAWTEPRNARAAVLFLLSGGRPAVIRKVMETATFPRDVDRLLKAALAYAEGEDAVARALLETIDPTALPTALGAHVALVRANLVADQDAKKAVKYFDLARLLAPGTLIEEAALRREVFMLADAGMTDKSLFLARQYLHRFRTSVYAGDFKLRFAAAAMKLGKGGTVAQMAQFDTVLSELPPAEVRSLYLTIAKTSLLDGRTEPAHFAAQRVFDLAKPGTPEEARAQLYLAASTVASGDANEIVAKLKAIDPARLSPDDAALRDAALAVGTAIYAVASASGTGDAPAPNGDPVQATLDHGATVIADSDKLFQGSRP